MPAASATTCSRRPKKIGATGVMVEKADYSSSFVQVTLHPAFSIESGSHRVCVRTLHAEAHQNCFVANSVNFPIRLDSEIIMPAQMPEDRLKSRISISANRATHVSNLVKPEKHALAIWHS